MMTPSPPLRDELDHVQLALDVVSLGDASVLTTLIAGQVRRLEVGTPLVLSAGLRSIAQLRNLAPGAEFVADVKICDAGERIARTAYAAGADIVTAVAAAIDDTTWRGILSAASEQEASGNRAGVILDTIGPRIDPEALARLAAIAAEAAPAVRVELCIHRPKTGSPRFAELFDELRGAGAGFAGIGLAGKLRPADVAPALAVGFDTLVVGSAVSDALDPAAALAAFADTPPAKTKEDHHL
jgi:3-dehydro-L-gulonate-6-phosphate decarboxylase